MKLRSSARGSALDVLKKETFNHEREVSTCDGLRMTKNFGILNEIPGTLPKLARSWSLLLEEVFSILFLEFFQNW